MTATTLTPKVLNPLVIKAYTTARDQGFYNNDLSIEHHLMMLITEIGEVVQADRKNMRKATINDCADTLESELADVAIRIMSLIGYLQDKDYKPHGIDGDIFSFDYRFGKGQLSHSLTEDLYFITQDIVRYVIAGTPSWVAVRCLQADLAYIFALTDNRNICLLDHINKKMEYNEKREYLHGCKY